MFKRISPRSLVGLGAVVASLAMSASVAFASGGPNPAPGSGGGTVSAGGGGGGGGSSVPACGTLTGVYTHYIGVYTTRTGIGFAGQASNCTASGGGRVYTVEVTDTETNPACAVLVPHYTSYRAIQPGGSIAWSANSTLIHCTGRTHVFTVELLDGTTVLDTTTASMFY